MMGRKDILNTWLARMSDYSKPMTSLMLAHAQRTLTTQLISFSPSGLLCEFYITEGACDTHWTPSPFFGSAELYLSHNSAVYRGSAPRSIYEWAGVDSHWAVKELEPTWAELHCNLPYRRAVAKLFADVLQKEFMGYTS